MHLYIFVVDFAREIFEKFYVTDFDRLEFYSHYKILFLKNIVKFLNIIELIF